MLAGGGSRARRGDLVNWKTDLLLKGRKDISGKGLENVIFVTAGQWGKSSEKAETPAQAVPS